MQYRSGRSIKTRLKVVDRTRRPERPVRAHTSASARCADPPIIETRTGKTFMTTTKLIAANFAAWSLAFGIWALNLGMFQTAV